MLDATELAPCPRARVHALLASFTRISEEAMRQMPFYNDQLGVEAIAFEPLDGDYLGALLTPWFLNLVLIPPQTVPYAEMSLGTLREVPLPCGPKIFRCGGTADFGLFYAYSVRSPVDIFKTREQARAAARQALRHARTPSGEIAAAAHGRDQVSRRTLFRFAGRPLKSEQSL